MFGHIVCAALLQQDTAKGNIRLENVQITRHPPGRQEKLLLMGEKQFASPIETNGLTQKENPKSRNRFALFSFLLTLTKTQLVIM